MRGKRQRERVRSEGKRERGSRREKTEGKGGLGPSATTPATVEEGKEREKAERKKRRGRRKGKRKRERKKKGKGR